VVKTGFLSSLLIIRMGMARLEGNLASLFLDTTFAYGSFEMAIRMTYRFTVLTATWQRGKVLLAHIKPVLYSVYPPFAPAPTSLPLLTKQCKWRLDELLRSAYP
jgi:hypothetical protein